MWQIEIEMPENSFSSIPSNVCCLIQHQRKRLSRRRNSILPFHSNFPGCLKTQNLLSVSNDENEMKV